MSPSPFAANLSIVSQRPELAAPGDTDELAVAPLPALLAPPPLPMLVTGVAGVPGYNAFRFFRELYGEQVIGTRRADNWTLREPGIHSWDVDDRAGLRRLFERYQFRSVVHCEGLCKLKSCELNPDMARRVNVTSLTNLIGELAPTTRLVALSVDLVFSGAKEGPYTEDDPTDPVTVYGATMAEAERIALERRPDACLLRISLPMGVSFNGHAGAIDWIQSRFKKDKPATLFYDEIRTPTYTDCLNRTFLAVLNRPLSGVFHAGGPRRLSLYEIAQIVNRVGGYDSRHLRGCLRREAGPMPPRAGDVTLNSDRLARELGFAPFNPWPLRDEWAPTHHDRPHERPADEHRSPAQLEAVLYRNPGLQ